MKIIKIIILMASLALSTMLFAQSDRDNQLPVTYINRIKTYIDRGAWQEAKRVINEGLELYPTNADLRYYNGRYYYVLGDLNEARYNLVRSTQEDDQHFASRRLLVDVEDTLHHYSSAICYINELLELQPYDRDLWRRKIGLYRKLGNHREADAALGRLAHIYPNDTIVQGELRQRNRDTWNQVLHRSSSTESAENLERWIDLDPKNSDYYLELIGIYEHMGEYERALGAVNRGLNHLPHDQELVNKGIGILTLLGLHTQALAFSKTHSSSQLIYQGLLHEVADKARLNDPYEVNGRLYELTGDAETLNYLINTSLTRGFDSDARVYLGEALRREGRIPRRLLQLYSLEKKTGNEHSQITLLEELLTKQPNDSDLMVTYAETMMKLATREMEGQQWADARTAIDRALQFLSPNDEAWGSAVSRQITVLGHLKLFNEARLFYQSQILQTDSVELRSRFASAYEDMAANHIRALMEEEQYEQALHEAEALRSVVPNSQIALRTCINCAQTLHRDVQFQEYALQGYTAYPEIPYFINKYALSLSQQDRLPDALELLSPRRFQDEWVNPQLVAAHSGISHEWAMELMRRRMPDLALEVVDSALFFDPTNKELLYDRGVACERLKRWAEAYENQSRYYEPSNAEQQEYYRHMRWLGFQSKRNRLDVTYNHAFYDTKQQTLMSIGHLYSTAALAYSYLARRDTYTAQITYKGIDGYHETEEDEEGKQTAIHESGGAGLEFMGQWEHTFNHRWSSLASLAVSTRYFNLFGANVQASYAMDKGWTPSLRLGYRRTPETYLFLGADAPSSVALSKYHLLLFTPALEKATEWLRLNAALDFILLDASLYYNVSLKGKIFVSDDNITSVSLVAGFGSFPELNFFEQTALRGLSHTNSMVGFDAQVLLTRNLYVGLAGAWNTCFNPYRMPNGELKDSYRNIYSLNAQIHVAF